MSTKESKERKDIVIVLDESGSMSVMGKEPVEAINMFLNEQKKLDIKGSTLTLYKFNTNVTKVYEDSKLEDFEKFSDYNPKGMTALYDAIGKAIEDKKDITNDVTFLIITDGENNSSKEYNRVNINNLVDKMKKENNWDFTFLGANQDSYKQGGSIGIKKCHNFQSAPMAYDRSISLGSPGCPPSLRRCGDIDEDYHDLGILKLVRSISADVSSKRSKSMS